MKSSLFSKMILVTLALALATGAFAANDSHKANFQISEPTQVSGNTLPAGDYTAKWEGSGPSVQVSITQGKKVIATVPAQVVALQQAATNDEAEVKNGASGDRELTALRFSGKKVSLELGSESAKAQMKTDSAN